MTKKDNVASLYGNPVIQKKANPGVVKLLEELLESARSGVVIGFAGAVIDCDDCSAPRRAGVATRGLLGALAIAQHRMIREFEE